MNNFFISTVMIVYLTCIRSSISSDCTPETSPLGVYSVSNLYQNVTDGFAVYKLCEAKATNIIPKTIKYVPRCPERCTHPRTGTTLSQKYEVKEIRLQHRVTPNGADRIYVSVIKACTCERQRD